MRWYKLYNEAGNPYWDKDNLFHKEKTETVIDWVHANVPKREWENATRWIEKNYGLEPNDDITLMNQEEMEQLKDDISFFCGQ